MGHPSFKCPKWEQSNIGKDRRVSLTQKEEKKEENEPLKESPLLEGEFLMLNKGKLQQQEEPKVSIFRIQCLCQGKIYKLIVDSGSYNNLVSYKMVNKLNLQIFLHRCPYYATWIRKEQHILIREQAYVSFSIGEYHYRVLCDVVPMTCAHLILGRPWQYGRKRMHDGYTNRYLVHKDGQTFLMNPLNVVDSNDKSAICFGDPIHVSLQVGDKPHMKQKMVLDDNKLVGTNVLWTTNVDGVMVG